MSEFLNKNMDLLKEKNPLVYDKVKKYLDKEYVCTTNNSFEKIGLVRSDSQNNEIVNVIIGKDDKSYFLCNHKNIENESIAWNEKTIKKEIMIEFVFGMGMGYHLEYLIKNNPEKLIIIIEPNVELFLYILSARDLSFILDKVKILLEESIDEFIKTLNSFMWITKYKRLIQLQSLGVYQAIFPELYEQIKDRFLKNMVNFDVDTVTRKNLVELWIKNYIKNAWTLKYNSNAEGLYEKFNNVPGILVSAGPSLEKNMHLLNGIKDKCVIASASTATISLKQKNISPHFFFTVDASEGELKIPEAVKDDNIFMVYSNQIYPPCIDMFKGKKFFINYSSDFYTINLLNNAQIKSRFIASAPSVANTLFDFLCHLGCNPIIFIGQDLSFSQNKQYAGNIDYGLKDMKFDNPGFIKMKDIYGEDIYTSPSFLAMRNCFDDQISRAPDKTIINCTEGGVGFCNAPNDTFQNIIDKYMVNDLDIINRINIIYESCKFIDIDEKITAFNKGLLKQLDLLEVEVKKQKNLCTMINMEVYSPRKNFPIYKQKIDEVNSLSLRIDSAVIYKMLLTPLTQINTFDNRVKYEKIMETASSEGDKKKYQFDLIIEQDNLFLSKINFLKGVISING